MRNSTINIAIAGGATLLSLLGAFIAIEIYLLSCRSLGVDAFHHPQHFRFIQKLFADSDYTALLQVVTEQEADGFRAVYDFNETVGLSRAGICPSFRGI